MSSEEIYNAWREEKNRIEIRKEFSDQVMDQIYQYERDKREPLFLGPRLLELISAHRLVKAAVVTIGAVAGIVRILLVAYAFLGC